MGKRNTMKSVFKSLYNLVLLLPLVTSLTASASSTHDSPGKERWQIKTAMVPTTNHDIDLHALLTLESPPGVTHNDARYQAMNIPTFTNSLGLNEGDTVTTIGYLRLVAYESDGDFHIQLTINSDSKDNCLIVELPDPRYVPTAYKDRVSKMRALLVRLVGRQPSASGSVFKKPQLISITGVLFYDDAHVKHDGSPELRGKRGILSHTLWELHPLWAIQVTGKQADWSSTSK